MQQRELSSSIEAGALRKVEIPASLTVRQLSDLLGISAVELIKKLMRGGVMANLNQVIDYDTAAATAAELGFDATKLAAVDSSAVIGERQLQRMFQREGADAGQPRPPVVTIMGHVDHGKTTLLDVIRQTNVIATEAGGITQHIGAYQVETNKQKITFIDTPGHEAFTAMRARGAMVTDIAVLVVAADDGVMPQTIEALAHARAAGVPIVVAITKTDRPEADVERVKRQLADQGLVVEEWGGDVVCVPVSGKTKQGIADLLENLLIVAELQELKANPSASAEGTIVESGLDKTRGPLATVLVQNGTLRQGDIVVVGSTWGRVKALFNDKGKRIMKAEPATPVKILGLNGVPQAGDTLKVAANEREARVLVQRVQEERQQGVLESAKALTLSDVLSQVKAGEIKELAIVLKADVQGSIEPIRGSLERQATEQVRVRIVHAGTGSITEGDVLLALASKGIVIGFNVQSTLGAQSMAETHKVDVRYYKVIYELVDEVEKAVRGMLAPVYVDVVEGRAEVREIFSAGRRQKVAGLRVLEGRISRNALARILRQGKVVHESSVGSLRRFKDNVNELVAGLEGGVGIEGFTDFQVGDIIELHRMEKVSGSARQASQPSPSRRD